MTYGSSWALQLKRLLQLCAYDGRLCLHPATIRATIQPLTATGERALGRDGIPLDPMVIQLCRPHSDELLDDAARTLDWATVIEPGGVRYIRPVQ